MLLNAHIPEFQTANSGSSESEGFIQKLSGSQLVPNVGWRRLGRGSAVRRTTCADRLLGARFRALNPADMGWLEFKYHSNNGKTQREALPAVCALLHGSHV